MHKRAYFYDSVTGEYQGSYVADVSPLEPDIALLPINATFEAPPEVGFNEVAVFDSAANQWKILPDFRNAILYSTIDGSQVSISCIGQYPLSSTDQPRPSPFYEWEGTRWILNRERAIEQVDFSIKQECDRRINKGGCNVAGNWFESDLRSRSQLSIMAYLGSDLPNDLQWKTMAGEQVKITLSFLQQILLALVKNDQAIFYAAESHRTALEASNDPSTYDYSGGWPIAFEDHIGRIGSDSASR